MMRKTIVRDPTNVRRKPKSARRARRSDGSSWDAGCVFVLEIISAKAPNEPVGKVLLTSETDVFGGHLTLPRHEIVDCGAFCEITFFRISPRNLLEAFFYSLNDLHNLCGKPFSET
jgi:hypothetical protein